MQSIIIKDLLIVLGGVATGLGFFVLIWFAVMGVQNSETRDALRKKQQGQSEKISLFKFIIRNLYWSIVLISPRFWIHYDPNKSSKDPIPRVIAWFFVPGLLMLIVALIIIVFYVSFVIR